MSTTAIAAIHRRVAVSRASHHAGDDRQAHQYQDVRARAGTRNPGMAVPTRRAACRCGPFKPNVNSSAAISRRDAGRRCDSLAARARRPAGRSRRARETDAVPGRRARRTSHTADWSAERSGNRSPARCSRHVAGPAIADLFAVLQVGNRVDREDDSGGTSATAPDLRALAGVRQNRNAVMTPSHVTRKTP